MISKIFLLCPPIPFYPGLFVPVLVEYGDLFWKGVLV